MLSDLADELLDLCWKHCNVPELRALRLCSKAILPSATSRLFRHITLLPTEDSAEKCLKLMRDDGLRLLVAGVTFDDDREEEDGLPDEYNQCCRDAGNRFPNLRNVEIRFSERCTAPDEEDGSQWDVPESDSLESRDAVLKMIFDGLHQSTAVIKHLAINNYQNMVTPDIADSDSFKAVLSGLDTLALHIVTEDEEHCPESNINKPELHSFFNQDLNTVWLRPLQTRLTSLTLYSTSYWGYFPGCPLGELHFPHLTHLALGNYTFAHESQLDFICAHGKTLQFLSLDDCPILHHCTMRTGFRHDRLAPTPKEFEDAYNYRGFGIEGPGATWTYEGRWHTYFRRLQTGLPMLKDFRFGHGAWDSTEGPMSNRHLLAQEIVIGRYVAFHGGTGPSQWIEPRERNYYPEDGLKSSRYDYGSCWDQSTDQIPEYPPCDAEDMEALGELLMATRSRVR